MRPTCTCAVDSQDDDIGPVVVCNDCGRPYDAEPEPRITPVMVGRLKKAILAHIHGTADKVDAWAARENRRTK